MNNMLNKAVSFFFYAWCIGFGLKFGSGTADKWLDLLDKVWP